MTRAEVIEAEAFAQKQREKLARDKFARAAARVAAGETPRCAWAAAGHRYDLLEIKNGMITEVCMDCGGRPRTFPVGRSSMHATVIEFPENPAALDAAGQGRALG